MNIPRDPEFYFPSKHAVVRKRERNIAWDKVSETLSNGEVRNAQGNNCKLFVGEYAEHDNPIGVMANVQCGEIITVEWRK